MPDLPRVMVVSLSVHPVRVAATRLRIAQYAEHLEMAGLELTLWSLFRDEDLDAWYGRSNRARAKVLVSALLRVPVAMSLIHRADVVVVQREALPLGPPLLELYAARRATLVWDVDDAVWHQRVAQTAGRVPAWLRAPKRKYERICAEATEVWAGSEVLASWCRVYSSSVRVIPTVVPVPDRIPPAPAGEPVIGWIGTHSTGPFMESVLPALAGLPSRPRVIVVGASVSPPAGVDVEQHAWSEHVEDEILRRLHVGLYPVDESHPLAEGKCGLKAVLYLAHGVSVVTTPTTTNAIVVRAGVDGLHARTAPEWTAAVGRLISDPELRERLRVSGWQRVRDEYSLAVWGPRVAASLRALSDRAA